MTDKARRDGLGHTGRDNEGIAGRRELTRAWQAGKATVAWHEHDPLEPTSKKQVASQFAKFV